MLLTERMCETLREKTNEEIQTLQSLQPTFAKGEQTAEDISLAIKMGSRMGQSGAQLFAKTMLRVIAAEPAHFIRLRAHLVYQLGALAEAGDHRDTIYHELSLF